MLMHARPSRNHMRFCGVDVVHAEVEVELLGMLATWPGWNEPIVDPLEREGGAAIQIVWADSTDHQIEPGRELHSSS